MGSDLVAGAERVCGRGCAVREPVMLVRASGGVALFPEACVVPSAACTQLACRPPVRVCVFVAGGAGACIGQAGRDPRCAIHPFIVALGGEVERLPEVLLLQPRSSLLLAHADTHTHISPEKRDETCVGGVAGRGVSATLGFERLPPRRRWEAGRPTLENGQSDRPGSDSSRGRVCCGSASCCGSARRLPC